MVAKSNDLEKFIQKMVPNLTRLLGESSSKTKVDKQKAGTADGRRNKAAAVAGSRYTGMAKKATAKKAASGVEGPKRSVAKKTTTKKK